MNLSCAVWWTRGGQNTYPIPELPKPRLEVLESKFPMKINFDSLYLIKGKILDLFFVQPI